MSWWVYGLVSLETFELASFEFISSETERLKG